MIEGSIAKAKMLGNFLFCACSPIGTAYIISLKNDSLFGKYARTISEI